MKVEVCIEMVNRLFKKRICVCEDCGKIFHYLIIYGFHKLSHKCL